MAITAWDTCCLCTCQSPIIVNFHIFDVYLLVCNSFIVLFEFSLSPLLYLLFYLVCVCRCTFCVSACFSPFINFSASTLSRSAVKPINVTLGTLYVCKWVCASDAMDPYGCFSCGYDAFQSFHMRCERCLCVLFSVC